MSKDLTDCEIILTNYKWDHWFPNYVIYRKSRDENFVYQVTLTPKKKRQLMSDWIKNAKSDFCFPSKETLVYNLLSATGVSYETRRKNNRPWRVRHNSKHLDYYHIFEEAVKARENKAKEIINL